MMDEKRWTNSKVSDLVDGATETFVYDNVEVRKTGRKADRKLKSGKVDIVVEVTPVDSNYGSWAKWVSEEILFKVK